MLTIERNFRWTAQVKKSVGLLPDTAGSQFQQKFAPVLGPVFEFHRARRDDLVTETTAHCDPHPRPWFSRWPLPWVSLYNVLEEV